MSFEVKKYTNRHGRCRPCNVVFEWQKTLSVLVRDSYCPKCGRKLAQTATALLDTSKTPIVKLEQQDRTRLVAGVRS